jgi:prolipoprotein diacylglyceryl transferase
VSLAAIPSPSTAVWTLGPIPVRAYALFIVLGIIAACVVTEVRMRRRGAPPYLVLDVAVAAVLLGIVGARLYHVLTSPDAYFGHDGHPLDAFKIWRGGLGIWGGVAGGMLGGWIVARMRGVPLTFIADAAAPGIPLAQAIGRLGNWFNNELYGRQTSLPWGLKVHVMDDNNPGHALVMDGKPVLQEGLYQPTFLYELLWDVGVAILVWQLDKRHRYGRGRAFALYVMAYTVGRFWIEALRVDTAHHFLGLRLNDWTSIIVFLGALLYFVRVKGPQTRLVADADGKLRAVPVDAPDEPAATGGGADPQSVDAEAGGDDADGDRGGAGPPGESEAGGGPADSGEPAGTRADPDGKAEPEKAEPDGADETGAAHSTAEK